MAAEAMKRRSDDCPGLETLAAYLDDRLSAAERSQVAAHIAECETCYFVFTEAAQMRRTQDISSAAPQPSERLRVGRFVSRRAVWSVGGALAAAAAIILAVRVGWWPTRNSETAELQALVAISTAERPVEGRLSGGFAYGPVRAASRSANSTPVLSPDVRISVAKIEKEAVLHRTPAALRALGLAYIVAGDLDKAVPALEEAVDTSTPDARALSDLSAAYLARGVRAERPQDLAKALTMAERAVKADPKLIEARFNRAFALERLSLTDEARQAWRDYLQFDDSSGWATEARTRLRALEAAPRSSSDDLKRRLGDASARGDVRAIDTAVAESPSVARQWLHDEILTEWPRAVSSATDVRPIVERVRAVAEVLARVTGDRFMLDAAATIEPGTAHTNSLVDLARAHDVFRNASEEYSADRTAEAVKGFQASLGPLERAQSPFAVWAKLYLSIGRYSAGDFAGAEQLLEPTIQAAEARSYFRVLGLSQRMRGLIRGVQGNFAGALDGYRQALTSLQRSRETADEASMHALVGEVLGFLGESELAWSEFSLALARLPDVAIGKERQNILQFTALAAVRDGLPETAAHFQNGALTNAQRWGRMRALFDAHLYQSDIHRQSGDEQAAVAELDAARQTLTAIDDPSVVARNDARIRLAEGETIARTHPAEATESLSKALKYFQQTNRDWPVARVLLARSRAYLAMGRSDVAEVDLDAGIHLFERRRAAVADEVLRAASFEQPWDLYSEMIRLQAVDRHLPDRALVLAERARARTLIEAIGGGVEAVPSDPTIANAELPSSAVVVYYAALDDRLLIWTLSQSGRTFVETPSGRAELTHLVRQARSEMDAALVKGREMPSLARLYDVLLRPIERDLEDQRELVIIPDGPLHAVPFAALVRRERREFVIERHAVQIAPSLTVFLSASQKTSGAVSSPDVAVFGNPITDTQFPDLPEAEAEARDVAALYDGARLFTGSTATKSEFLNHLGRQTIVHFAGHAFANDNRPDLSRLLLAGGDEASRSLFAREIAARDLSATSLVVLGACRTNTGRIRRGEGVFTLARPFLAAGVPTVVASLWDVNDRATHRLLVAFHRALARSTSAASALRAAQLALMADGDSLFEQPVSWAGFTVIGGRSAFQRTPEHHTH